MHRYTDLNRGRNSRLTRLEGNLVVANRKRANKTGKTIIINSQFFLWIVILIMFSVSALYIRYQALYVEDSVFRDGYLLINEHFLTKNPLPTPGVNQNQSDAITQVNSVNNNSISANPTSGQNIVPQIPGGYSQSGVTQSQVPSQTVPRALGTTGNDAVVMSSPSTMPITGVSSQFSQTQPQVQPRVAIPPVQNNLGMNQENPNMQYSAMNRQSITGSAGNYVSTLPNLSGGYPSVQPLSQVTRTPTVSTSPASLPQKSEVFSYYQPILNSKSTKVGFFVVNKKTDYNPQQLYQVLFQNLLVFQSNNPKVKNFFDPQTRLNNAWLENNTLLLDFNSAFENSKYGYMGIEVKIQQVLWTFFNFKADTVNKVGYISFLIDGKRKDVVGGDGKILKPFYSRKDLRSVITL